MTHDEKIRFLDNLDEAIKRHQADVVNSTVLSNASMCALQEVRNAFAKAVHMENYTKELNPSAA